MAVYTIRCQGCPRTGRIYRMAIPTEEGDWIVLAMGSHALTELRKAVLLQEVHEYATDAQEGA